MRGGLYPGQVFFKEKLQWLPSKKFHNYKINFTLLSFSKRNGKALVTDASSKKNTATPLKDIKKQKLQESESESESESEQEFDEEFDSESGSGSGSELDDEFSELEEDDHHEKIKMFSDEDEEGEEKEEDAPAESDEYDAELYSDSDDDEEEEEAAEGEPAFIEQNDDLNDPEDEDPTTLSPTVLRDRIHSNLKLLSNWKESSKLTSKSRSQIISAWYADIAAYYSYSLYMVEKLASLFGCEEALQFFEANEQGRPVTLRVNTLKTRKRDLVQALTARGVTIEALGNWTPVGLQVFDTPVPIGATPEYLAGHYLLQAASSLLPVQALDPQAGDRVLDMSAAPGGKSTHLAALMRNTGVLFANDASRDRIKSLIANIHRMGVHNTVVCNYDARKLPSILGLNSFQRILLDAPCSGTGVISKDPTVKASKTDTDFTVLTHLQKELILAAADMCEAGGFFVYSTCSVTVEENEEIVAYALSKRKNLRLVDTGIPFGREGFTSFRGKQFPQTLKLTRRFYPHMHNMDGFYVSKFEKIKQ